jgi:hypothetical protein
MIKFFKNLVRKYFEAESLDSDDFNRYSIATSTGCLVRYSNLADAWTTSHILGGTLSVLTDESSYPL